MTRRVLFLAALCLVVLALSPRAGHAQVLGSVIGVGVVGGQGPWEGALGFDVLLGSNGSVLAGRFHLNEMTQNTTPMLILTGNGPVTEFLVDRQRDVVIIAGSCNVILLSDGCPNCINEGLGPLPHNSPVSFSVVITPQTGQGVVTFYDLLIVPFSLPGLDACSPSDNLCETVTIRPEFHQIE